jgi:hypothetical protein
VYATENVIAKKLLVDYYFLNFKSNGRKYNFVAGEENRQSFGMRLHSQNQKLNYELEGTYQCGTFNQLDIDAYALNADVNYKIDLKSNLIFGLSAQQVSGDKKATDNTLNTYNPLFAKGAFGLTAPIGITNLESINAYLKINPMKKLGVVAGAYFIQRKSNQDATYSPGLSVIRPKPSALFASNEKGIGTIYTLETNYAYNQNLSFGFDASHFVSGRYVQETGKGKNINYLTLRSTFKF